MSRRSSSNPTWSTRGSGRRPSSRIGSTPSSRRSEPVKRPPWWRRRGDQMLVGGVDVGSTQTKAVIMDGQRRVLGRSLIDTGGIITAAAENAFQLAVADAGVERSDVAYVVGTGYGRYKVTFGDTQVTEISCHARGGQYLFPKTRTVLDIGGQDTKAIKIGPEAVSYTHLTLPTIYS